MSDVDAYKKKLADELRGMTLDETPGGVDTAPLALAAERGRREGWNMLIRHLCRALEA